MRILLIHRYFWPDTPPYAAMLRTIGRRLVSDGHEVVVLSTQPSYKSGVSLERQPALDVVDGMSVRRLSMPRESNLVIKLFNMVFFPARIFFFILLSRKFDRVMVSTAPPVVAGFAAAIGSWLRRSQFFYHCMDIHPEIGSLSGEFRNPIVFKMLVLLDQISCRIATNIIVLSEDMRIALLARQSGDINTVIINNFSLPTHEEDTEVASGLLKRSGRFRVLFAGNVGRFQGLDAFVDAMDLIVERSDVELVFLGEGKALKKLQMRAKGRGDVIFLPHQPSNIARQIIADADLGIVSLNTGIYRYAFPSKTMTYLSEGCPLLVSVERESQLAKFVEDSGIGVCVEPSDPASIAAAIQSVHDDIPLREELSAAARKIADEMFSEEVVLQRWSALMSASQ